MAASSVLMDKLIGKTIAEVDAMDYNEMMDELGRKVRKLRDTVRQAEFYGDCLPLNIAKLAQSFAKALHVYFGRRSEAQEADADESRLTAWWNGQKKSGVSRASRCI
jgi:NifU-like protein involved in Fe-S cluster formation